MKKSLITIDKLKYEYKFRKGLFRYGHQKALQDISLTIHKGETFGLIGKNGAGKSTLLRLIAGILEPTKGTLAYHEDLSISLLTLQLGFSPELSGRDNAILGAMFFGNTYRQAKSNLSKILEFSELGDRFLDPIKSYSSGMRARLGFSVAIVLSPDVLMIDEVFSVGDEIFQKKSSAAMKEKMRSGQTIIFVSHQLPIISELCDRVAWIENGMTKLVGTTNDVISEYRADIQRTQHQHIV